jgi:glutathione synthase/RimK-type ligase-like ATP-grasp enzyme
LETYDLATAWCWEYDADFVHQIDRECAERGVRSYLIHPHNLLETLNRMENGELVFRVFFDRASDQEEAFDRLVDEMLSCGVRMINHADRLTLAIDKARMQRELVSQGIRVPKTVVLPAWHKRPELRSARLAKLVRPLVVKPASGGCGDGVTMNARSVEEIQSARQQFPDDRYLVQEKIVPVQINGRRAWFRVFFAFGEALPCWWDDRTKIADVLSWSQIEKKTHSEIIRIMRRAARISRLELFSTEIALTSEGKLVVVDPVNDQVDLRRKSSHFDGIPDEVVDRIVFNLVDWVKKRVRSTPGRRKVSLCAKT